MEKVKIIREWLKTAQSRQKSYVDVQRRELEFEVGDWVFLKVSPMKRVMRLLDFEKDWYRCIWVRIACKFGFCSSGIPCIHVEEMHWRSFYGIASRGYQSDRLLVLRRRARWNFRSPSLKVEEQRDSLSEGIMEESESWRSNLRVRRWHET